MAWLDTLETWLNDRGANADANYQRLQASTERIDRTTARAACSKINKKRFRDYSPSNATLRLEWACFEIQFNCGERTRFSTIGRKELLSPDTC